MQASRFVAPKRLTTLEEAQTAFQRVQEQLDALVRPKRQKLVTSATTLIAGEFVRISPRQGQTLIAKLPRATQANFGEVITISLERPNGTLRVSAEKPDVVGGLASVNFNVAGLIILESNGVDSWMLINQLATNSPGQVTGPQGPMGLEGPEGPEGPQGLSGQPGTAGAAGAPGAPGATGPQGIPGFGLPGEDGQDGDVIWLPAPPSPGTPGPAGATGAAGSNGGPGPAGEAGADGDVFFLPGPAGSPGAPGATGPQGQRGFQGDDGADGDVFFLPGTPGATGATGATGGAAPLTEQTDSTAGARNNLVWSADVLRMSGVQVLSGFTAITTKPQYINTSGNLTILHNSGLSTIPILCPGNVDLVFPTRGGVVLTPDVGGALFRVVGQTGELPTYTATGLVSLTGSTGVTIIGNDGVNPTNTITAGLNAAGITLACNGANNPINCQAGNTANANFQGGTVTIQAVNNDANISATQDVLINAFGAGNIVRVTGGTFTAGTGGNAGGYLAIKESAASTPSVLAGDGMLWVESVSPNRLVYTSDENVDLPLNSHVVARLTSAVTVTATTTPTDIISYTRPARADRIGTSYRITAVVLYTKTAVTTTAPSFRLSAGGTQLLTVSLVAGDLTAAAATNLRYSIEMIVTIRTLGAAGVCTHAESVTVMGTTQLAANANAFVRMSDAASLSTLSTTVAQAISFQTFMAAAVAGNSVACQVARIERLD